MPQPGAAKAQVARIESEHARDVNDVVRRERLAKRRRGGTWRWRRARKKKSPDRIREITNAGEPRRDLDDVVAGLRSPLQLRDPQPLRQPIIDELHAGVRSNVTNTVLAPAPVLRP